MLTVSVAILSDGDVNWRPDSYRVDQFGFRLEVDFPTVKLLDYDEQTLMAIDNPFAMVTLAHLQTIAAGKDDEIRLATKTGLARLLFQKGYDREYVRSLFNFIHWILNLPPALELQFQEQIEDLQDKKMEYMNPWQERGYLRGMEQGQIEGAMLFKEILQTVRRRFGIESMVELMDRDDKLEVDTLKDVLLFIGVAKSINDVIDYIENYDFDNDDA